MQTFYFRMLDNLFIILIIHLLTLLIIFTTTHPIFSVMHLIMVIVQPENTQGLPKLSVYILPVF